jgi:hypothetical protein
MYHYYSARRQYLKERIDFHLSSFGFGVYCDYAICNRIDGGEGHAQINLDCLYNLNHGDKLFINAAYLPNINDVFIAIIQMVKTKNIKLNFYIMCEPKLPYEYVTTILPHALHIYLMNNEYDHPQIHHMPIGIRDGEEVRPGHKHFTQKTLLEEGKQIREKKYLCLLCFSSGPTRIQCEQSLGEQSFVFNLNKQEFPPQPSIHCGKVPVWINYEKTHESWYVLSPPGAGIDCHRFYEAIYLNAIPIVKRTNTAFDKLYHAFPCLIVDEWTDVTEDFLENMKEPMTQKMREFKEKYPNFMTDLDSISDLLLQT